jgi:hypothetical protein
LCEQFSSVIGKENREEEKEERRRVAFIMIVIPEKFSNILNSVTFSVTASSSSFTVHSINSPPTPIASL